MDCLYVLFVEVKDFYQTFLPKFKNQLLLSGCIKRRRARSLSYTAELIILIHFQQSHYPSFKTFEYEHGLTNLRSEFPGLVRCTRFF